MLMTLQRKLLGLTADPVALGTLGPATGGDDIQRLLDDAKDLLGGAGPDGGGGPGSADPVSAPSGSVLSSGVPDLPPALPPALPPGPDGGGAPGALLALPDLPDFADPAEDTPTLPATPPRAPVPDMPSGGPAHRTGTAEGDVMLDVDSAEAGSGRNARRFDGGAGNDVLTMGDGDDTAIGGEGDDRLLGGHGQDLLLGGAGADTLIGGAGQDLLTGGLGADHFEFRNPGDSGRTAAMRDRITDFSAAEGDIIDLSQIDAKTSATGEDAFVFIGSAAFVPGTEGALQAQKVDGGWLVRGEVNGDGIADFTIFVASDTDLKASDFLL